MKRILILVSFFAIVAMGCNRESGKVGNINPDDVSYFKDSRTNLCFAIIGAKKGADIFVESTSIGMVCVPCDSLKNVLITTK